MSLRQILYTSQSAPPMTEVGCRDILAKSHENNRRDGITGLLVLLPNGTFVQILEGERSVLQSTMQRIERDPRHNNVGVIFDIEVPQRSFADWEMGFRAPGEDEVADMAGHRNTASAGDLRALFDCNSPAHAVMRTICNANLSKLSA
ncbi:MAG: hypothetical protein CMM61_05485 [Rhodospirillaceae bacterium]|nr:hypothetical protein [Rhodospirillaceae bacterium]